MQPKSYGIICLVLIWAAVLAHPETRSLLVAQISSRSPSPSVWSTPEHSRDDFQELAQRYPNDLNVLAMAAEHSYSSWVNVEAKKICREYDRLIQRFPDQAWLIAARLRHTFGWLRHDRVGGELSDADAPARAAMGVPSPERSGKPNFTPQELQQVIALCHKGQQIEPDNAYFDWMLTYFLLAGYRDKEAFTVLYRGGVKPRYDDYVRRGVQATIAARELERPLLWEEKLAILLAESGGFSVSAKYRELARLIVWRGIKAQRRGDHRQALNIYGGLLRMGIRMREGSSTYIGGLVAGALTGMASGGPSFSSRKPGTKTLRQQREALFQKYATVHGRIDLARVAAREVKAAAFYRQQVKQSTNTIYGTSLVTMAALSMLWRVNVLLLLNLLLVFVLTPVLTLIVQLRPVRNSMMASGVTVLRRDIVLGVLACGSGLLLLLACDLAASGTKDLMSNYRWLLALTPALCSALACIESAMRWQRRTLPPEMSWHKRLTAAMRNYDLNFLFTLIANWSFKLALPLAWVVVVVWPQDIDLIPIVPAWVVALFFLVCLAWPIWKWSKLPHRRVSLGYGLRVYRHSLVVWLIVGSACYLCLMLAALPVRREADRRIDAVIEYGEVRASSMK